MLLCIINAILLSEMFNEISNNTKVSLKQAKICMCWTELKIQFPGVFHNIFIICWVCQYDYWIYDFLYNDTHCGSIYWVLLSK